jgi:hypothetical protein
VHKKFAIWPVKLSEFKIKPTREEGFEEFNSRLSVDRRSAGHGDPIPVVYVFEGATTEV